MSLQIRISWVDCEGDEGTVYLSTDEYFDDDDEGYSIDSVPKFQWASAYIESDRLLSETTLHISDSTNERLVHTRFWDQGESELINVMVVREGVQSQEIILSQLIPDSLVSRCWQISRLRKERNNWNIVSSSCVEEHSDGTQTDHRSSLSFGK